jgi:hypothetical protein
MYNILNCDCINKAITCLTLVVMECETVVNGKVVPANTMKAYVGAEA